MRVTKLENITHAPVSVTDFRRIFNKTANRAWATDEEAQTLFAHIKTHNIAMVVEIGTAYGFTASCMALAGAVVMTFDIEDRPKIWDSGDFPAPELRERIFFSQTPSPECFKGLVLPPDPVLFFIDGDHSRAGCQRDYDEVMKIARPGDLVFIHDVCSYRPVGRVWAEIEAKYPGKTTLMKSVNGLGLVRP